MKMERTEKEKREKFVKFSNHRLQKAIEHIELIGKLANKRAYSYSESDINIISEYLTKEVNKMQLDLFYDYDFYKSYSFSHIKIEHTS
jgi:hypothetical protein